MAGYLLERCLCKRAFSTPLTSHPTTHRLSFSTTTPPPASQKQTHRLTLKRQKAHRASYQHKLSLTQPDPILGYPTATPGKEVAWVGSELAKLVVAKEDVWSGTVSGVVGDGDGNGGVPRLLNFGLTEGEVEVLFEALPAISAQQAHLSTSVYEGVAEVSQDEAGSKEDTKVEHLARIVDLRNADSQAITKFNVARIEKAFTHLEQGREEGWVNKGCPEVQAAVLTYRIHLLLTQLWSNITDIHNRRTLTRYVQNRAKVLKYLKRLDIDRYEALLPRLGLEPRAVEGEVVVRAGLPPRPSEGKVKAGDRY